MESLFVLQFSLATVLMMVAIHRSRGLPGWFCSWLYNQINRSLVSPIYWYHHPDKDPSDDTPAQLQVRACADRHELASLLVDLIDKDGAGAWPPRANHDYTTWPAALQGYPVAYHRLEHLLSTDAPSADDRDNRSRIDKFRAEFRRQLRDNVDLDQVRPWLREFEEEEEEGGGEGRWGRDALPRDTLNAFWCCVALSRHAYRWGTIPVVVTAQLERELELPMELVEPWKPLQRHFGCNSQSGNITSNFLHNIDAGGRYIFKANAAFPHILSSEESFTRIMVDVEAHSLPIYHSAILATIAFEARNTASCAFHMARTAKHLEPLLSQYYDGLHDKKIARKHWLSYVQGIHAWGLISNDDDDDDDDAAGPAPAPSRGDGAAKHNGVSGNQLLAFQVLDAFVGLEPYLSAADAGASVPLRQRRLCRAFGRCSFRHRLGELGDGASDDERAIQTSFGDIVKRLRMFRAAHRKRSHDYLSQSAPERIPMTAGKGALKITMDESLKDLDKFMVGRLGQTV